VAVQPGSSDAPTMTRAVPSTGISRPTLPPPTATPASGTTSPVERTGTTVVLGKGQLFGLAAVFIVLIGGLAALGYAALRRGGGEPTVVATAPTETPAGTPTTPPEPAAPPPETTAAADPAALVPTPIPTPAPAPAVAKDPGIASGTAGRGAAGRGRGAKPLAEPPVAVPEPTPAPPVAEEPPAPAAPAAPVVPPVTFEGIKMLVRQGNTMRESDAVMTMTGSDVELLDRPGGKQLMTLPFGSISQAFYSRSKEPKWKGADGREQSVNVDLGRMSFFRGERNWLILISGGQPVFVRFEDGQMQSAFNTFQQRSGVKIQR
jgi:hypothetical protein